LIYPLYQLIQTPSGESSPPSLPPPKLHCPSTQSPARPVANDGSLSTSCKPPFYPTDRHQILWQFGQPLLLFDFFFLPATEWLLYKKIATLPSPLGKLSLVYLVYPVIATCLRLSSKANSLPPLSEIALSIPKRYPSTSYSLSYRPISSITYNGRQGTPYPPSRSCERGLV
jgi:hypothetical protein